MRTTKINYLFLAIIILLFAIGLYHYAWERYDCGDYDAAGAYVCMVSMLCYIIALSIKDISFSKKVRIGIGVANILVLSFLIIDCGYSNERTNLILITLFIAAVHVGFYIWAAKKERLAKKGEQNNQ